MAIIQNPRSSGEGRVTSDWVDDCSSPVGAMGVYFGGFGIQQWGFREVVGDGEVRE